MVGDRRGATAYAAAPNKKLGKFTSTKMRSIYPTLTGVSSGHSRAAMPEGPNGEERPSKPENSTWERSRKRIASSIAEAGVKPRGLLIEGLNLWRRTPSLKARRCVTD